MKTEKSYKQFENLKPGDTITEERFYTTEEECREETQIFIFRQIQSMEDKAKHLRGLYEKKEGRN